MGLNSQLLIAGMGRSGTTVTAQVLAHQPEFLYIEEPNFITDLYIPYMHRCLDPQQMRDGFQQEGWRGPMKFLRMMSEMYPVQFGDDAPFSIRKLMKQEFDCILNGNSGLTTNSRERLILKSLDRIIKITCQVTSRESWLIKQPNAILSCAELLKIWPNMIVIHVTRRLELVIASRLRHGFQPTFNTAFQVCKERLQAAAELKKLLPKRRNIHIRIEDLAHNPLQIITKIFDLIGKVPSAATLKAVKKISEKQLNAFGDPESIFSKDEMIRIFRAKEYFNALFNEELV